MKRDISHQKNRFSKLRLPAPGSPPAGWRRGVTLIELMVAAVIMFVVTGAAFTLFQVTVTHEARQQEVLTQTQNLRAALYAVSRDIRMAGSGLSLLGVTKVYIWVDAALYDDDAQAGTTPASDWYQWVNDDKYGVRPIMGTNSDKYTDPDDVFKSDSLTIFRTEVEGTTPIGQLSSDFTPGTSTDISLGSSLTEGESFSTGDMVAIVSGDTAVIVQVTVPSEGGSYTTLNVGARFKPAGGMPTDASTTTFLMGSPVYNLRDVTFVTYYVDIKNHRLMANYHDLTLVDEDADDPTNKNLVTVADNIEDFQVAYFLRVPTSTDLTYTPDISGNILDTTPATVVAVQMAMVSRAKNPSTLTRSAKAVEVMDHTAKDEDGYTRRVMTELVQLRNFQQ